MVSNIFCVHSYLGNVSILTHMFQMGLNHQPVHGWKSPVNHPFINGWHWCTDRSVPAGHPSGCFQKIGVFPPKWMVKRMEFSLFKWMIWGGFHPLFSGNIPVTQTSHAVIFSVLYLLLPGDRGSNFHWTPTILQHMEDMMPLKLAVNL